MDKYDLNEFEKTLLNKFIKTKKRTKEEIEKFVRIILISRERPDKNPQLKE